MLLPDIEWCKLVGSVSSNALIQWLFQMVKLIDEKILALCKSEGPFPKPFQLSNITLSDKVKNLPRGDYKVVLRIYDSIDPNVYNLTYYSTISS